MSRNINVGRFFQVNESAEEECSFLEQLWRASNCSITDLYKLMSFFIELLEKDDSLTAINLKSFLGIKELTP